MMTHILLIRHGQTDWNAKRRWKGQLDVPLNEEGKRQGRALAKRLQRRSIHALYSSDLRRAAMTAEILSATLGLRTVYDQIWRERDVGDLGGLTNEQIRLKHPQVWKEMRQGTLDPPNGENHQAFYARTGAAFERLVQRHPGESVAVVSHGGTIATLVAHVLGMGANCFGRLAMRGNTGLTTIEVGGASPRLTLFNDTCHLEH